MKLLVEAIVLHEMIHWADFRDGIFDVQTGPSDPGFQFELAAYGMRIGRFWEEQTTPFQNPGFSDIRSVSPRT
jgi:hypothetical protein